MAVKLSSIFSDNMVLQADAPIVIQGKARPFEKAQGRLCGKTVSVKADGRGRFSLTLPPMPAGGPFVLSVNSLRFRNVLVGDLWLCSGQSNMEFPVQSSTGGISAIKNADNRKIRFLTIPRRLSTAPLQDLPESCAWKEVSQETLPPFSAVGWYFGEEIQKRTGRPVGLINASWGGTRIEPWTSLEGMKRWERFWEKYGFLQHLLAEKRKTLVSVPLAPASEEVHLDEGNTGILSGFHSPDLEDAGWKTMRLPGYWTSQGLDFVGSVWLRRRIIIPKSWLGYDLYLSLGAFVDFDTTYFNGESVGFTGKETPNFWSYPRKYVIPARQARPGYNTIAVRIFAHKTVGGSCAHPSDLFISVINRPEKGTITLAGDWKYVFEKKLPRLALPETGGAARKVLLESTTPTLIYNAMISPLRTLALKGILWYQGESNAEAPEDYVSLFRNLIADWRGKWGTLLPFYFVQLAGYAGAAGSDEWPRLRDAQRRALVMPETGMASAIDLGEPFDIHPKNKKEVGLRLARIALAKTYGRKQEYSGPLFRDAVLKRKVVEIRFDHVESGLYSRHSSTLTGFELATVKGAFVRADAIIRGRKVLIRSPSIAKPAKVRYGWHKFPVCNLYNRAGLPAIPFSGLVGTTLSRI